MDRAKIEAYWNDPQRTRDLVSAVTRLVNVKSVKGSPTPDAPFGPGPDAALTEALKLAEELGLSIANYDHYVGLVDLNGRETRLHILGHLDVVGEGSGWSTDPYSCVEKDGILYGRGVSDDKGPMAAALLAMKAVQDLGVPLTANARLILGTDEESGSDDIAYYYAREPYAPYTFSPDADFPVINIEKGSYKPTFGKSWDTETAIPRILAVDGGFRINVVPPEASATLTGLDTEQVKPFCKAVAEQTGAGFTVTQEQGTVRLRCTGKNAHAASPDSGVNAITALLTLFAALPLADCESTRALRALHTLFPHGDNRGQALGIAQSDETSGALTLTFSLFHLDASGCKGRFDSRVPLCAGENNCKNVAESAFARYGFTAEGNMGTPHYVDADSPLVKTLLRCYETYTGVKNAKPLAIGGGTYVHDIPGGVAFGCDFPGFDPKMHAANEQASVGNLLLACKIFTQAICDLCS
ncbi:MAG: Sapep family Mn(2+)-dependent dipeptidase [Intestinimonas sp.]|jgi:succinyl-diaminopimelate desuccinylase|nr:Sapep family Mn(2+)-dependent dipeptidase [Intestinimonas sp.]